MTGLSLCSPLLFFFFFNDPAPTEIYTLSLHDALPFWMVERQLHRREKKTRRALAGRFRAVSAIADNRRAALAQVDARSEEHTSELQSPCNLVCRLLLEKKQISSTHASTKYGTYVISRS